MNPPRGRAKPTRNQRLVVEEMENGDWEVVFYGTDGKIRHVSHSDKEIAALRAAYWIARYYGYKDQVLVRARHVDHHLNIDGLMSRRDHMSR